MNNSPLLFSNWTKLMLFQSKLFLIALWIPARELYTPKEVSTVLMNVLNVGWRSITMSLTVVDYVLDQMIDNRWSLLFLETRYQIMLKLVLNGVKFILTSRTPGDVSSVSDSATWVALVSTVQHVPHVDPWIMSALENSNVNRSLDVWTAKGITHLMIVSVHRSNLRRM